MQGKRMRQRQKLHGNKISLFSQNLVFLTTNGSDEGKNTPHGI